MVRGDDVAHCVDGAGLRDGIVISGPDAVQTFDGFLHGITCDVQSIAVRVRGRVECFRLFGFDCGGVVAFRPVCGGHDLVGVHPVASVVRDHGDGQHVQQSVDVPAPLFPLVVGWVVPSFRGLSCVGEDIRNLLRRVIVQEVHGAFRHAAV